MAAEELNDLFSTETSSVQQIEENVHARLQEFIESYDSGYVLTESAPYVLHGKYQVHMDQPLPQLDTVSAKAYVASGVGNIEADVFALMIENDASYRLGAAEALSSKSYSNAIRMYDRGRIYLSDLRCYKRVFIYERPPSVSLHDVLKKEQVYHERQISYQILTPIIEYLKEIKEKSYSHGRINPRNIFLGKNVLLGECVSDRSGISQDPYFEPIERLLATPAGRGEPDEKTDIYALGMVVYAMLFGMKSIKKIPLENLPELIQEKGVHGLLIGHKEMSPTLDDFFRGVFANSVEERWGLEQISSWLDGKRFSLVLPGPPRDSSRGIIFNEKEYFNAAALASGFHQHWNGAMQRINHIKLDKWIESSQNLSVISEDVLTMVDSIQGSVESSEDALSRLLRILDRHAPLRTKHASAHLTGIGAALIEAFQQKKEKVLSSLTHMIASGLPQYTIDLKPVESTPIIQHLLWQLPSLRQLLDSKGRGFGVSRIMYEMNSALPCQSEILKPYALTDTSEVLRVLDMLARDHAASTSLDDPEIGAFLACKMNVMREQKIRENLKLKTSSSDELITINILAIAQHATVKQRLPGLSAWVAIRLSDYINHIHSRKTRSELRRQLVIAAKTGVLKSVLNVVFNGQVLQHDQKGFKEAGSQYKKSDLVVQRLQQKETFDRMVKNSGDRLSVSIGYILVLITSFILLFEYLI